MAHALSLLAESALESRNLIAQAQLPAVGSANSSQQTQLKKGATRNVPASTLASAAADAFLKYLPVRYLTLRETPKGESDRHMINRIRSQRPTFDGSSDGRSSSSSSCSCSSEEIEAWLAAALALARGMAASAISATRDSALKPHGGAETLSCVSRACPTVTRRRQASGSLAQIFGCLANRPGQHVASALRNSCTFYGTIKEYWGSQAAQLAGTRHVILFSSTPFCRNSCIHRFPW